MKLFFQIFGGVCAVILAVVFGNVIFTKYQLYEANKLLVSISSNQNKPCSATLGELSKLKNANKQLSNALIAAQKEIKAFKSLEAARSLAFSNSYEVSEDCLVFKSDRHMVECQNKKRRARDDFYREFK